MAEGALFSVATNILSTLSSPEYKKAHERAYVATGDVEKLRRSLEAIHAVLLDAERQQESSAAVKVWIGLVRDVLYDAEDLFDEILTTGMVRQQTGGGKIRKQVRYYFSPTNSRAYAYIVGARVKDVRKSLDLASKRIKMFCFVRSQDEEKTSVATRGSDAEGSFVDSKRVIGRNAEEKDMLEFLLNESSGEETNAPVFALVGIGGMGKTTLARVVYDNDLVEENFENKWWAGISDTDEDTEILRRICKAMDSGKTHDLDAEQLKGRIKESAGNAGKYLLVIDGACDENREKWSERLSLLPNGCVGCRIIVTTRSILVARAVGAVKTYTLSGLSDNHSLKLFKMIASTSEEEEKDDPRWTSLRKWIVNKCSGVPLAITLIASHLSRRSMEEWEKFSFEELSKIELSDNVVMSALKLSYDHLPSELKRCFAYCALFPKDFVISKQKLLYLWIAQGYVNSYTDEQTVEEIGYAYLNQLLPIFFLEKAEQDEDGEIERYKMHDLVHGLAQIVAGDEVAVLTENCSIRSRSARHAFVGDDMVRSFEELPSIHRLRSCLFVGTGSHRSPVVPQQLAVLRHLRALELSDLSIEDVPHYIGDFKFLRYLNLSRNPLESLPESISKLVNLITLDISGCGGLKGWPRNMRRLINLRHLDFSHCPGLTKMPDGFGGLHLQHLSDFKPGGDRSMLEEFSRLTLKGKLTIDFAECHVQDDDECWQLPATVEMLRVCSYLGAYLPRWRNERVAAIVRLEFHRCENLKRLPALKILSNLKILAINGSRCMEYVEEETTSSVASFPCLENLSLVRLPELKGWSRGVKLEGCVFPRLKKLEIAGCGGMELWGDDGNRGVEWDSLSGLRTLEIWPMPPRESLPPCLLQRDVQVLEYSFSPPEPAPVEHSQTSDGDDDLTGCLGIRGSFGRAKTTQP